MSRTHSRGSLVLVALVLLALASLLPTTASAEVTALTAAPSSVAPGGTSVLVIDADEGAGTLSISASAGTLTVNGGSTPASCGGGAVACTGVGGNGSGTVSIPDTSNDLGVVVVLTYTAPATGPVSATVTATQGNSRTVAISVGGVPRPTPTPIAPIPLGGFVSGSIPSNGGFGLVVFEGGSYEDLVRAAGCPGDAVSYWSTDAEGRFLLFLPGAPPPVSSDFARAFPGGVVPSLTALIGKCTEVSTASGIQGRVTIWPPQPICFVTQPCPEQPYSATLVILNAAGETVARVISSPSDGRYRVELVPGSYTVVPAVPDDGIPTAQPVRVDVPASRFVTVDIQYDSGIRY